MKLGERILQLRTENNMSQGDLADVLNVSRQSVSKWETDTSIPELEKLMKMGEVFKVSLDELVYGKKEKEVVERQDTIIVEKFIKYETRKIVGLGLIGIGIIILVMLTIFGFFLEGLVVASPFVIIGLMSFIIKIHTGLYIAWTIYIILHAYFRYATGIRFHWAFNKWVYREGLEIHLMVAWAMVLGFAILTFLTIKVISKSKPQTGDGSLFEGDL